MGLNGIVGGRYGVKWDGMGQYGMGWVGWDSLAAGCSLLVGPEGMALGPRRATNAHMDLLCVRDYWQDSCALQNLQDAEFTSEDWLKLWIPPLATWTLLPVPSALTQHPACTCEPPHNHTCSSLCLCSKWKSNFISFKSREGKERYLFSSCLT